MKNTSPWRYIPSLYFLEGLPYILINVVSGALYTKMGMGKKAQGIAFSLPVTDVAGLVQIPEMEENK